MLLNLEMSTPLWLESAGHNFLGQVISEQIRQSLKGLSTDTTLIVSCARSSDMVRIMVDSPKPSPCKPTSPSQSSSDSSLNTSERFLRIYVGTGGLKTNLEDWDILSHLLDENGGFSVDVMTHPRYGKLSLTIHRDHSRI